MGVVLNNKSIAEAVKIVKSGGVIAYPTEAVYGLGCDPFNEQAFNKLLELKQRPIEKGVILIASDIDQIKDLVEIEECSWTDRVLNSWELARTAQGFPITWILPVKKIVPHWITGGRETLAVRVTNHPAVIALCDALSQPLVSTSANLTGMPSAKTAQDCNAIFPNIFVLDGETGSQDSPSQIWDALTLQRLR